MCLVLYVDLRSRSLRSDEQILVEIRLLFASRLVDLNNFYLLFLVTVLFLYFLIGIVNVFSEMFLLESSIENPLVSEMRWHFCW